MDKETSSSNATAEQSVSEEKTTPQPTTKTAVEHRQAYGTAKTENLQDSGLWRVILPAIVGLFCVLLFVFPLFILIPLLSNSITAISAGSAGNQQEAGLLWVWIVMIVIEVIVASIIILGLYKVFMTQASNYQKR